MRAFFYKNILNLLFYAALAVMFFISISWSRGDNNPIFIFNHTIKHVLTDTMEPDIPVGSLILVQRVSPEELELYDIITFALAQRTTVTQQILNIFPDYIEGQIGFQTGGIDQPPDEVIVLEQNVVGRVVYSIPRLGAISRPQNLIWLLLASFVIIVITCYRSFASNEEKREKQCETKTSTEED